MYTFKPSRYNVTHDEITRFSTASRLAIKSYSPGWRKNSGTITLRPDILPESFYALFHSIGQLRKTKAPHPPQPRQIR